LTPLSVGNGRFTFTADVTGLQSFPETYRKGIPLCIESAWGWHTVPNRKGYRLEDTMVAFDSHGRKVKYAYIANAKDPAIKWLRANPHRLGLGRIGLQLKNAHGHLVDPHGVRDIDQRLDLWSGLLTSRYQIDGQTLRVDTCCHPARDQIAVRIKSDLIAAGRLCVTFQFPYGSESWGKEPGDWEHDELHKTTILADHGSRVDLLRELDATRYYVTVVHAPNVAWRKIGRHRYDLTPATRGNSIEFTATFSARPIDKNLPDVDQTIAAAREYWRHFWNSGGAIDLSGSTDPRAMELERRIVLSQYLTAIQEAGTLPPAETGLTFNSWYGKAHLEMHWWHGVHFALWGRLPLLERSLPWYRRILPHARATAQLQGYQGARWPKMVGPDGREGPSTIAPFLIWQQPHPIYYAELCYRTHGDRATLERYRDIVFASAEFMASFATWESNRNRYVLGPPVMPAQERYDMRTTYNPTFELQYWRWGLETAQQWRRRLGLPRNDQWDHVLDHLAKLPVKDGYYLTAESAPDTWTNSKHWTDHPSFLAACGLLPGKGVDRQMMRRTLRKVMQNWNWSSTWGWDYPLIAMTAARLGEPDIAIDALMMRTPRNRYLRNGHNYMHDTLPVYLPGNGGLLTAAAMMAAGWDGAPRRHAPGFPVDGSWTVRCEGLEIMP